MSANGFLSVNFTARQRRWWVALAVIALALLSLRPACEAWLSHWAVGGEPSQAAAMHVHGHGTPAQAPHGQPCCGNIEAFALVKPADMLSWQSAQTPPILPSVRVALAVAVPLLHAVPDSVIPPGSPPFYVRSARILR